MGHKFIGLGVDLLHQSSTRVKLVGPCCFTFSSQFSNGLYSIILCFLEPLNLSLNLLDLFILPLFRFFDSSEVSRKLPCTPKRLTYRAFSVKTFKVGSIIE